METDADAGVHKKCHGCKSKKVVSDNIADGFAFLCIILICILTKILSRNAIVDIRYTEINKNSDYKLKNRWGDLQVSQGGIIGLVKK